MSRLADALQRANQDKPAPAPFKPTAVPPAAPAVPAKASAAVAPRAVGKTAAKAIEAPARAGRTQPLITPKTPQPHAYPWRHDPELVGKVVGTDGFSAGALEQYRKLAATLHHAQEERHIQVIMTISSLPGEGKSLTAVNLALTLSGSYERRVLLVDADLRRPTVQRMFNLPTIHGLTDGLKAATDTPMPLLTVAERLVVLPAGRPDPDPLSGLTSERVRRLIVQAREAFDWVIIDTPPVTLLPDANLLTSCADGALLVVRSSKAPFSLVKRTVDTIGHDNILGVVMNAVDFAHDRNAGGYYEYYGYGYYGAPQKG